MEKRLMICPGAIRREGWMRLDGNPAVEPDFLATIPPIPPEVLRERWDEIEWVHGISSLYPWQAEAIAPQLYEALCPGGKLVLEQPNFEAILRYGRLDWIYGDPAHERPEMMNHWSYTPASLTTLLVKAGFRKIGHGPAQYHHSSRDFRVEAWA